MIRYTVRGAQLAYITARSALTKIPYNTPYGMENEDRGAESGQEQGEIASDNDS